MIICSPFIKCFPLNSFVNASPYFLIPKKCINNINISYNIITLLWLVYVPECLLCILKFTIP